VRQTLVEMEHKLDLCMLVNLPYKAGSIELGPANRKGIISYLANFGHSVTLVVPGESTKNLQQFHSGSIYVLAIPYTRFFNNSSLTGKFFNTALNAPKKIRSILRIFKQGKYNLIYVKGDILDGLIAIYIKRKYRIPFVFDSEPPGMVWEVYKIKSRGPKFLPYLIAKIHDSITTYTMKKADLITPSSKWFGEALAQKGIQEHKLMPYPNGVDIALFSNKDGKDIREKYQLNGSQVIIYIGTLDKARDLSMLIQAFSKVKKHKKKVKLLIVGDGSDRGNLQCLARELQMEEGVIFIGQVPGSEIPKYIAAADIGVSPVPPLACYKMGSPLKIFEYMGGGKPVIANEEIFDQKEVLEQSNGGILVPYTPEAFADAMIELLNNPEKANEMGQRGRRWVVENRSHEILARQMERRLSKLILPREEIQST
jgi:glycosyltransferase involved in cell wall biosynthesis